MVKRILALFVMTFTFSCSDMSYDNNALIVNLEKTNFKHQTNIVAVDSTEIPNVFSLSQNYPNPFNYQTTFRFTIPTQSSVKLILLDSFQNEVDELLNKTLFPGTYSISFSSNDLDDGIYYYKLVAGNFSEIKEMLIIKTN